MASVGFKANRDNNGVEDDDDLLDFQDISISKLSRPTDHYKYLPPPRNGHFTTRFFRDPVTATLSQLSRVANYAHYANSLLSPSGESYTDLVPSPSFIDSGSKSSSIERNKISLPPSPPMKVIQSSKSYSRLTPLNENELNETLIGENNKTIFYRIFCGGIENNELRQKLWPLILGLTDDLNTIDWMHFGKRFEVYQNQWTSIDEDQESRFTAYHERKSIAERDVVRSDRNRPFFFEDSGNIDKLKDLLLSYIMYDFDTGYVQGMSDLASPILYVFDGDTCKAYWCFVQMMKLFKRNFEMSQNSISNQLKMLMKLIKLTDPYLAEFLVKKDSDNCYFAFRWIICIYKREFMKQNDDNYDECLLLWETVWSLAALSELQSKETVSELSDDKPVNSLDSDSNHTTKLTDVELYILCIALTIIRRERDNIINADYDASDILKHFNTLKLKNTVNVVLLEAGNIYNWIKYDDQEVNLYMEEKEDDKDTNSIDGFEVLNGDLFFSTLNV